MNQFSLVKTDSMFSGSQPTAPDTADDQSVEPRAADLFAAHQQVIFKRTDRIFACLLLVEWVAGVVASLLVSPRTWTGASSETHPHVWMAVLLGGALAAFPVVLAALIPGRLVTRHVVALGQMLMSALLIHLSGGRIETHFHVFGSLAILAFYRDWRVLITATVVVASDHFLRGVYAPQSVYGVLTADGWRWVEHAGWVIFEDIFLVLSCVQSLREMRDIATRQAQLEASNEIIERSSAQLRESETRFRSLSDFSPSGVFEMDTTGRATYANDRCLSIFGMTLEECAGDGWANGIHPEDREETLTSWNEAMRDKRDFESEYRIVRPDGEMRWAFVRASVRLDHGKFSGHVGAITDITERKQSEQMMLEAKEAAERANEAKSTFLSRMSHELRTPLNSILGFAQLLQMGDQKPRDAESVDHIMKAGRHLLGLINEVLDVARVESGKLAVSLEPVPVGEIVGEAIGLVQPLAAQSRVHLALPPAQEPGHYITADRQRLKQVLLNILANAVKYNREGGSVTITYDETVAGSLIIRVADTGNGIRPEMIPRLFIPFDRLDAEQSNIDGTGLGLTVSKALVEAMRGTIEVRSEVGVGTEFSIVLPVASDPVRSVDNSADVGDAQEAVPNDNVRTVLYIEDNAANLRLIETILERRPGIKLVSAMQGGMGVEMARTHRPDAALLDMNLPDISGQEVLRKLKEDPTTRHIPVIMISADATEGQAKRLLESGAHAYMTKPIEIKQFLDILDDVLLADSRRDLAA